jgi:tRNA(Ile)-lysidine synthetase-like protein
MSKQQFITEWFDHPDWWFGASTDIDVYLSRTYQHLLFDEDLSKDTSLDWVIILDQLPRHVYRNQQANHVIAFYLEKALHMLTKVDVEGLNNQEWCFAMLPIRHKLDTCGIFAILPQTWKRISHDPGCIIRRFLKATYERCPTSDQTQHLIVHKNECDWTIEKHTQILHFAPTQTRVAVCEKHPIVKEVSKHVKNLSSTNMIMSLSGGVDSMVCLHILDGIKHHLGIQHIHVVHINYTNRSSAYDEEKFVVDWATSQGYHVCVRRIEEIKREQSMQHDLRNVYEAYTRNVRYGTYKTVDDCAPVVLGHNRDDCLENIFTNIAHQGKYDNLFGMKTVTEQDGIRFFRPLLNVTKEDIIHYARDHNIPYLPNSTPTWSQRGQIRSKIVPCLETWNVSFVPGLFSLSHALEDASKLVDDQVRMYTKNIREDGIAKTIDFDDKSCIPDSRMFWSAFIFKLSGVHTSTKSLDNFLERLVKYKASNSFDPIIRIELKKSIRVTLKDNHNSISMSFVTMESSG